MTSTPIPVSVCPHCGYRMDMATGAYGDAPPKPGDVRLCAKCAELSIFDEAMRQRPPTPEEGRLFYLDPRVIRAQIILRGHKDFPKMRPMLKQKQRKQNGKGTTGEQH